jgi:hypothetical protein
MAGGLDREAVAGAVVRATFALTGELDRYKKENAELKNELATAKKTIAKLESFNEEECITDEEVEDNSFKDLFTDLGMMETHWKKGMKDIMESIDAKCDAEPTQNSDVVNKIVAKISNEKREADDISNSPKAKRRKLDENMSCAYCQFKTPIKVALELHVISMHGDEDEQTKKDDLLTDITEEKEESKGLFIEEVDSVTEIPVTVSEMDEEARMDVEDYTEDHLTYYCDKCDHGAASDDSLESHRQATHAAAVPCKHCDKQSSNMTNLRRHYRRKHAEITIEHFNDMFKLQPRPKAAAC